MFLCLHAFHSCCVVPVCSPGCLLWCRPYHCGNCYAHRIRSALQLSCWATCCGAFWGCQTLFRFVWCIPVLQEIVFFCIEKFTFVHKFLVQGIIVHATSAHAVMQAYFLLLGCVSYTHIRICLQRNWSCRPHKRPPALAYSFIQANIQHGCGLKFAKFHC